MAKVGRICYGKQTGYCGSSNMQELLSVKGEARRHGGERKGNYLLVRVIKRVMEAT